MKWKIDNKIYTLTLTESYTTYSRSDHLENLENITVLKKRLLEEDRHSKVREVQMRIKEIRSKIAHFRRMINSIKPTMYHFTVVFKRYRYRQTFVFEFNPKFNNNLAKVLREEIQRQLGIYRRETLQRNTDEALLLKEFPIKIMGNRFIKGKIFIEPGQIYKFCLKRKVKPLYETKLPTEKHKYVGLELEFCAPMAELDLAIILWKAGIHKFAQLKHDGSLRPKMGEWGYELALLLPEQYFKKNLRQVCKILESVKARADERRCGLHVHLDMRRRKKDIVYNNLVACQNVFSTFLDPARRDNEFCRLVESRKFPTKFQNIREERYKTVNAASYYKYKTLEVRMHEGSVNFKDITNWMNLLIKIANYRVRMKSDINELTQLKKRIRIDAKMNEFFQDKVCFWQLQGPQRRSPGNPFARVAENITERLSEDAVVSPRETTTASMPQPSR